LKSVTLDNKAKYMIAVPQSGRDEVLDLKNVMERVGRDVPKGPIGGREMNLGVHMFERIQKVFFRDNYGSFSGLSQVSEWARSRTSEFAQRALNKGELFSDRASQTSAGFLKTQIKVQPKAEFPILENKGQTVLATPEAMNCFFGPWSKTFLRNVRLAMRPGVFLDSGYSDRELSRALRECNAFERFRVQNVMIDIEKQDSSHSSVTLYTFYLFLVWFGVPEYVARCYLLLSSGYDVKSLNPRLYRAYVEFNLGSGDAFTLIRNIFQVLTTVVDRYEIEDDSIWIVKGDDVETDDLCLPSLYPPIDELRRVGIKRQDNCAPYHAGRFLAESRLLPDPIRMLCKIICSNCQTAERYYELEMSFYDRYESWDVQEREYMKAAVLATYADFDAAFLISMLNIYEACVDPSVLRRLVISNAGVKDGLMVIDTDVNCFVNAMKVFTDDPELVELAVRLSLHDSKTMVSLLTDAGVPCHRISDDEDCFGRPGLWFRKGHCVAVVDMIRFNDLQLNDQYHVRYTHPRSSSGHQKRRVSGRQGPDVLNGLERPENALFVGGSDGDQGAGDASDGAVGR